ncbi:tryptophan synthase subunit alpha [Treponema pectinovorum]|uniref:tryptophan synthase subunit alpha n=1 Tax=Treponema pectinovorum TaxID=164 RepID=UPI003D931360
MKKLMAHIVANYPNPDICFSVVKALVEGGTDFLEVQLPFSDPCADGPVIQAAGKAVLEAGYKTADAFKFIKKVHEAFPSLKIALMSYVSLVFTPGVENFCKRASESGVNALMIPDLPFDSDECVGEFCKKYGMQNIPVASTFMREDRLNKMLLMNFKTVYVPLRANPTAENVALDKKTVLFLKKLKTSINGCVCPEVYASFGIHYKEQAEVIFPYVDGIVAGSIFIHLIESANGNSKLLIDSIREKAKSIKG